ncbi:myb-like protein X [Rhopilema esculentum]|uniref:myb-like protein X n=1 Tax=Rhopilema esculentum TaxID=499914 RepID=UPI0031D720DA
MESGCNSERNGERNGERSGESQDNQTEQSNAPIQGSFVFVPRLELDLSNDDIQLDVSTEPNSPYEKRHSTGRSNVGGKPITNFAHFNATKIPDKECSIEEQMIAKLEKSLVVSKKKGKEKSNTKMVEESTIKSGGDERVVVILHHLKFVQTWNANNQGRFNGAIVPLQGGNGLSKWWQRRPRVSRKEILKISFLLLEKYHNLFNAKLEEVSIITEELLTEKKNSKGFHLKIARYERERTELIMAVEKLTIEKEEIQEIHERELKDFKAVTLEKEKTHLQNIDDINKAMDDVKRKWQEEVDVIKQSREKVSEMNEAKVAEIKREKEGELESLQRELEKTAIEKDETKHQYKKLVEKYNELKSAKDKEKEKEIDRLKYELRLKKEENKTLVAGMKHVKENFHLKENKMELEIRNLREELVLREQQLNEMNDRFGNQIRIARLCEKTGLEKEAVDDTQNSNYSHNVENNWSNENNNECSKEKTCNCCTKESEKQTTSNSCVKHEHFLDAIMPGEPSDSGKLKAFAFLKIEDVWEEQIACHESNVEKLKELQRLRKNLISSREELERSIQENVRLKESVIKENAAMEKRLKVLIKRQSYEMNKKEEEIENLKLELVDQKNNARKLSKELTKNMMIQKYKDEEIELLNATVKAENNDEYCIVTLESMTSFRKHIEKLRHENNNLLSYCDRVEEKVSETKRELDLTRKLGSELSIREMDSQKICKELMSEVDAKNQMLRTLKEKMRKLHHSYEEVKEEAVDNRYELSSVNGKLAKMQKKMIDIEGEKKQLEEVNSKLAKNLAQTGRELQKSVDIVCQLKIRYEHVEEQFKEKDDKINDFGRGKDTANKPLPQRRTFAQGDGIKSTKETGQTSGQGSRAAKKDIEVKMFSDEDEDSLDLAPSYVPSFLQNRGSAGGSKPEQPRSNKPSWLQDSVQDSQRKKNPPAKGSKEDDIFDSIDDLLPMGKKTTNAPRESGNHEANTKKSGRRSDDLFFLSDEGDNLAQKKNEGNGNSIAGGRRNEPRNRRRGQSGKDAADELKRLVGF